MTDIEDGTNNILSEAKMPRNFSWIVDNRLAGMGYPDNETNIMYLINNNIRHVISLTESTVPSIESVPGSDKRTAWILMRLCGCAGSSGSMLVANALEFETLSLKVKDFTPPTLDQIEVCLDFIDRCNNDGNAVVVHCAHGRGRTGTVLACYLVKTFNMDPEAAVAKLREMRPGSVETLEQEDMVKTFAETLHRTKAI